MKPAGIAAPELAVKPVFVRRSQEPAPAEKCILASEECRLIGVRYR
jgi:hypothetical protein